MRRRKAFIFEARGLFVAVVPGIVKLRYPQVLNLSLRVVTMTTVILLHIKSSGDLVETC